MTVNRTTANKMSFFTTSQQISNLLSIHTCQDLLRVSLSKFHLMLKSQTKHIANGFRRGVKEKLSMT